MVKIGMLLRYLRKCVKTSKHYNPMVKKTKAGLFPVDMLMVWENGVYSYKDAILGRN